MILRIDTLKKRETFLGLYVFLIIAIKAKALPAKKPFQLGGRGVYVRAHLSCHIGTRYTYPMVNEGNLDCNTNSSNCKIEENQSAIWNRYLRMDRWMCSLYIAHYVCIFVPCTSHVPYTARVRKESWKEENTIVWYEWGERRNSYMKTEKRYDDDDKLRFSHPPPNF